MTADAFPVNRGWIGEPYVPTRADAPIPHDRGRCWPGREYLSALDEARERGMTAPVNCRVHVGRWFVR